MPRIDDVHNKDGRFGIDLDSQKTEVKVYRSKKMSINGVSTTLKLRDTVGFGAMDHKTNDILKETFLDLVSYTPASIRLVGASWCTNARGIGKAVTRIFCGNS